MKKVIVCNGDSFMAGDELAMAEFYPEFASFHETGTRGLSTPEKFLKWNRVSMADLDKWRAYVVKCKTLAYPAVVGRCLNLPVINLAKGGQSNQTAVAQIIDCIETNLVGQYSYDEMLVILHLTSFDRLKVPNNNNLENDRYQSLMMTYPLPNYDEVRKFYLEFANDEYLLTDSLIDILGFIKYCEMRNISYILTECELYSIFKNNHVGKLPSHYSNLLPEVKYNMSKHAHPNEQVVCEMGHFSKVIHDRFGLNLAEIISNQYLTQ
jgi:hypothetical protein